MPRPSRNTDRLLIKAARELLPELGCCSELNLRAIAERAGVNLGMFHYHFKTKDEFLRVVLQDLYEEMFGELKLKLDPKRPPLENLRQALLTLGRFAVSNRVFLLPLLKDLVQGERVVLEFARANVPRHLGILTDLVTAAKKKKQLRSLPPFQLIVSLMSGVAFPAILGAGLEKRQPELKPLLEQTLFSEEALQTRVESTLKGLSP
ncbi:MAG: TetR/AcrR family transcriptional regulator [Oligoflexia bacterium]|nr:TetR/AcrR family transcriptional regulator [Oligoflexia bacterium]